MKVLLIYPYRSQYNLVRNYAARVRKNGVELDYLCIDDYVYDNYTGLKWSLWLTFCCWVYPHIKVFIQRHLSPRLLRPFFVDKSYNFIGQYDLIDFHGYISTYNSIMKICKTKDIQFDVTLWGSDILRANEEDFRLKQYGFQNCRFVKGTENLLQNLRERGGTVYDSKMRLVYFGNSDFDAIDSLTEERMSELKQQMYGNISGKLIMICGYNGISHQNHEKIIDAIALVKDDIKDKVHLVFPLTYGGSPEYIQNIRKKLERLGMSYTMLTRYLSTEEMATLRKSANIVVNIQSTDDLAGSLQDHLYCGNICIIGEWLNYIIYDRNGVHYIKTSIEKLADNMRYYVNNYAEEQAKCKHNKEIMHNLLSWESNINNWIKIYGE